MTLKDVFDKWKKGKKNNQQQIIESTNKQTNLTGDLVTDEVIIFQELGGSIDINRRKILVSQKKAVLIYIDGIVDTDLINQEIISNLQRVRGFPNLNSWRTSYTS